MLRDPVERAHSNWTHLRRRGLEPGRFRRGLRRRGRADRGRLGAVLALRRPGPVRRAAGAPVHAVPPRAGAGAPLSRAGRRARGDLDRVCGFLGVDTGVITGVPRHNVRPDVSGRTGAGCRRRSGRRVLPAFADDVARVAELTGWDLADWLADPVRRSVRASESGFQCVECTERAFAASGRGRRIGAVSGGGLM